MDWIKNMDFGAPVLPLVS